MALKQSKVCSGCKKDKALSAYPTRGKRCKACKAIVGKKRYLSKHGQEYWRRNHLSIKFGISPVQYNEMVIEQDGYCAICGRHQSELKRRLAVDHNHVTGEIRGLLCGNCNGQIALLENAPKLKAAMDYLNRYKED